jgi:type I restriction enzyme S subunit
MDVEKLKQKILDLAIRGKLVPQDPNDEPASVLIEKIRAEKEGLIKQGKIKRDKNESYIFKGDDNSYYEKVGKEIKKIKVPFEIPNTWQWVRLNEFGLFRKGPFGSSLTKEMFVPDSTPNRHKVYEQKNAIQKDWTLGNYYISDEKYKSMTSFVVEPNDIIVSCAGTIGEIFILPEDAEIGIINQALMRIRLYYKPLTDYFLMYFDAVLKQEASDKGKGTGMKNIPPFDVLKNMLFPLPTYEETIRILNKLTEISKFIEKIDTAIKDISVLSEQLKFKILDSFFSEKSWYKSYSENMKDLGLLVSGRDLTPDCYNSNNDGIPYLTGASNFENDSVIVNRWTPKPVVISYNGDVLITCKGTIGKTAINQIGKCHIARQIMAFRCGEKLLPEYVKMFFDYRTQELQRASSSLIPGISRDIMLNMVIPLPSIEIQDQIVKNIKTMFAQIERIVS